MLRCARVSPMLQSAIHASAVTGALTFPFNLIASGLRYFSGLHGPYSPLIRVCQHDCPRDSADDARVG